MARKGLPAKYAKMGFKKGWEEYRKVHGSKKGSKKSSSSPRRKTTMAKAKKKRGRVRTRFKVIGAIALFWLLGRLLIGRHNVVGSAVAGDFGGAMAGAQENIKGNFAEEGAAATYTVLFALAILTAALKWARFGSPVKGVSLT